VALPIILANPIKHLIAQAHSGTGKTAAFALGMLSRIDENEKCPQALCICPSRELASQIGDVIKAMGKFTKIETLLAVKQAALPRGQLPHQILVGTPGKMLDLIKYKSFDPKKIKIFVLDEADEMLNQQGLGDQSLKIHSCLDVAKCQILLFSATYEAGVGEFAERVVPRPHSSIRVKREELSLDAIAQYYIDCQNDRNKFNVLSDLYGHLTVGQTIIFVQRRDTARDLQEKMTKEGHKVALLYGSEMAPEERDSVMNSFRGGTSKVLITTNVLARGIDVLQVSLVINYDIPKDGERRPDFATYLHRIGRSGRFGRQGIAINFVHDHSSKEALKEIEDYFKREIKELPLNQLDTLDKILKELK